MADIKVVNSVLKRLEKLVGPIKLVSDRNKLIKSGSETNSFSDPVHELALKLHPGYLTGEIVSKRILKNDMALITMSIDKERIPPYKPGQYMIVFSKLGDRNTTRPFFILTPYTVAKENGLIEFAVIDEKDAVSNYFIKDIKPGDTINVSMPYGDFTYEPIRDQKDIVGFSTGNGALFFFALMKSMYYTYKDITLTLYIYDKQHIYRKMYEENQQYVASLPIKVFFTDSSIKKIISSEFAKQNADKSFFVVGEDAFVLPVKSLLRNERVPLSRIRTLMVEFDAKQKLHKKPYKKTMTITVKMGESIFTIGCRNNETILEALERNEVIVKSACRSGICGLCRTRLLSGEVKTVTSYENNKTIEKYVRYIHPCQCVPQTDITIQVPIFKNK